MISHVVGFIEIPGTLWFQLHTLCIRRVDSYSHSMVSAYPRFGGRTLKIAFALLFFLLPTKTLKGNTSLDHDPDHVPCTTQNERRGCCSRRFNRCGRIRRQRFPEPAFMYQKLRRHALARDPHARPSIRLRDVEHSSAVPCGQRLLTYLPIGLTRSQ